MFDNITRIEGKPIDTYAVRFERDPKTRQRAIEFHGLTCKVCHFNFGKAYGPHGDGYIEVHHLRPLSTVRQEHEVDHEKDLTVLCSNCHRMIHRGHGETLVPDELAAIYQRTKT